MIALIQEGEALHYVAVVGCDSESLYLADSLCPPAEGYNRVVSREEFARLPADRSARLRGGLYHRRSGPIKKRPGPDAVPDGPQG